MEDLGENRKNRHILLIPHHGLHQKVNMVEPTSPSLKQGSLPQLERCQSKVSRAEETCKKRKIIIKKLMKAFI